MASGTPVQSKRTGENGVAPLAGLTSAGASVGQFVAGTTVIARTSADVSRCGLHDCCSRAVTYHPKLPLGISAESDVEAVAPINAGLEPGTTRQTS